MWQLQFVYFPFLHLKSSQCQDVFEGRTVTGPHTVKTQSKKKESYTDVHHTGRERRAQERSLGSKNQLIRKQATVQQNQAGDKDTLTTVRGRELEKPGARKRPVHSGCSKWRGVQTIGFFSHDLAELFTVLSCLSLNSHFLQCSMLLLGVPNMTEQFLPSASSADRIQAAMFGLCNVRCVLHVCSSLLRLD